MANNVKTASSTGPAGYIYSFNGPHSLFVDTMRTIRILGVAWQLGHYLAHENDRRADLLKRSVLHGWTTNQYIMFHGDSDHTYDVRGRTAHEALFNRNDGAFRCRSSQQGYSPFSTWTREDSAWAMLGTPRRSPTRRSGAGGIKKRSSLRTSRPPRHLRSLHQRLRAMDGIVYWDDGARACARWATGAAATPITQRLRAVDSSASAIAAGG